MTLVLSLAVFALAVAIKGGLLGRIFHNWKRLTDRLELNLVESLTNLKSAWKSKNYKALFKTAFKLPFVAVAKWFIDGSIISVFLVLVYTSAMLTDLSQSLLFTLSYFFVLMSMGEEAGAAGDYKGPWGDYIDAGFGRSYGIKKGIQYGAFAGGCMALTMASWCPWIAGALFPLAYYVGNSIYQLVNKTRSWEYSEFIWGAMLGVAFELARTGWLHIS